MDHDDHWTVVAPIVNLEFEAGGIQELRIDRVTFIPTARFRRKRKSFGLPWPLSAVRRNSYGALDKFLAQTPVVAVARTTGRQTTKERQMVELVRDEIAILAASQLGYVSRRIACAPAILGERSNASQAVMWIGRSKAWTLGQNHYGPIGSLHLTKRWMAFQRKAFFVRLLGILRGDTPVGRAWRGELRRAAVLIGLSHMAQTIPDALLPNMIALELLLTTSGDKVGEALPTRASAFLGWSAHWKGDEFEERISRAYEHRCQLVHDGNRAAPSIDDVLFTDNLLLCLLVNLVTHSKVFGSKDDVVQFSRRVEAERLLGVRSRLRSLWMYRRKYTASDFKIY